MANTKILVQLRKQLEQMQSEYAALSEAYKLLSQVQGGRGRKPKLDLISAVDSASGSKPARKTGKRGRPPGSKNKSGAKKTGPKASKAVTKRATKKTTRKRATKKAVVSNQSEETK